MTRSSPSVLATFRTACFAYVLDNTVIVSLLCSRPPQFHAFVLSTLFQTRYVGHNHASDCFLVWLPVLVLHFLPFCIISTMFCFPCLASPTERVFVFLFVSLHLLWCAPAPFLRLRLRLLTLGCSEFALRASRVFLLCAETALVYFLVAVVPRGTLGWTGRPAPVCWCPGREIHATPTLIFDITSVGSTRFSALADLRRSFLQLHKQPPAPPLRLRSYSLPYALDMFFFFTCVARHDRNICDTFSDLCQSRYTRFGPVLSA